MFCYVAVFVGFGDQVARFVVNIVFPVACCVNPGGYKTSVVIGVEGGLFPGLDGFPVFPGLFPGVEGDLHKAVHRVVFEVGFMAQGVGLAGKVAVSVQGVSCGTAVFVGYSYNTAVFIVGKGFAVAQGIGILYGSSQSDLIF